MKIGDGLAPFYFETGKGGIDCKLTSERLGLLFRILILWGKLKNVRVGFERFGWRAQQYKQRRQNAAYIRLNNLYLAIQRKRAPLTLHNSLLLRQWVMEAYDRDDAIMLAWWQTEFEKLPHWFDF